MMPVPFPTSVPPQGRSTTLKQQPSLARRIAVSASGPSAIRSCLAGHPAASGAVSTVPIGGTSNEEGENTMSTPAHKLRDGCLQVVVWRNTSTNGQTYYTANPQRSYKAGDDTWKETDSLNQDDILAMAELLREAYAWIKNQKRADAAGRRQSDNVTAK